MGKVLVSFREEVVDIEYVGPAEAFPAMRMMSDYSGALVSKNAGLYEFTYILGYTHKDSFFIKFYLD